MSSLAWAQQNLSVRTGCYLASAQHIRGGATKHAAKSRWSSAYISARAGANTGLASEPRDGETRREKPVKSNTMSVSDRRLKGFAFGTDPCLAQTGPERRQRRIVCGFQRVRRGRDVTGRMLRGFSVRRARGG
eukprot:1112082-Rhodomonas_salina.5